MYTIDRSHWGRGAALGLLMLGLVFSGCDTLSGTSSDTDTAARTASDDPTTVVDEFAETADLSSEQTQALQDIVERYSGDDQEPEASWQMAADLQAELTSEQIDRLVEAAREQHVRRRGGHDGPRRWRRGGKGFGAMSQLDLTDEQKASLKEIHEKYRGQMRALFEERKEGSFDDTDREELEGLRQQMREEVRSVFTEEQLQQLESMREEHRERMGARREDWKEHREAAHAAMVEALGLTDEQQAQLKELRADAPKGRHRGHHGGEGAREALSSVLTADQLETIRLHRVVRMHLAAAHWQGESR